MGGGILSLVPDTPAVAPARSIFLIPSSALVPGLPYASMYADTFAAEGWDNLEAVHTMTEEDMLEIGVKRCCYPHLLCLSASMRPRHPICSSALLSSTQAYPPTPTPAGHSTRLPADFDCGEGNIPSHDPTHFVFFHARS